MISKNTLIQKTYRRPVILAVILHTILLILLISGSFLARDTTFSSTQQRSVQANLVSSTQLATLLNQTVLPIQKAETPLPAPKKPSSSEKTLPPKKPILSAQPVVQKTTPSIAKKNVSVQPKSTTQQKFMEEALLEEELHATNKMKKSSLDKLKQEQLTTAQIKAEEAKNNAAHAQETRGEIDKFKALILQQIQQNWIMPQKVENLSCILQIEVAPGGMVLNVKLIKSSGNAALDRSALAAVNKASPLPVPKDNFAFSAFRRFTLTVKPEGNEIGE